MQLNFPHFEFRIRETENRKEIFDPVRRKYVALTPEEWVRQHLILYLINVKKVPAALIGVEKRLLLNKMSKRFDLVVFSRSAQPILLAECKSPNVEVTEKVFDQAARYNLGLNVSYFLITNGLKHYSCRIDYEKTQYVFIGEIPPFDEMSVSVSLKKQ